MNDLKELARMTPQITEEHIQANYIASQLSGTTAYSYDELYIFARYNKSSKFWLELCCTVASAFDISLKESHIRLQKMEKEIKEISLY